VRKKFDIQVSWFDLGNSCLWFDEKFCYLHRALEINMYYITLWLQCSLLKYSLQLLMLVTIDKSVQLMILTRPMFFLACFY